MAKGFSKLHYIKPCIEERESSHNNYGQYEVNLSRLLMTRNDQQPTCISVTFGNQTLEECPQWRNSKRKYNIQSDIKMLRGKDCEVEKIIKFLKKIEIYE